MFAEVAILVALLVVFGLILKHQQLSLYNMFLEGVEATLQKHREGLDEIFRKHLEAQRRQSATTGYHQVPARSFTRRSIADSSIHFSTPDAERLRMRIDGLTVGSGSYRSHRNVHLHGSKGRDVLLSGLVLIDGEEFSRKISNGVHLYLNLDLEQA